VANDVDGVLRACEADEASGEIINVATGGRISLNHLFRTMKDLVHGHVDPTYSETRSGDVKDSQADITKAKRILGYQPIVSFEEGLKRTIEWYRSAVVPSAS
jgi:UDP-N-acetylglucosamine 4-epimerase